MLPTQLCYPLFLVSYEKWWNVFLVRDHCHCRRFGSQRIGSSSVRCIFAYSGVPKPVSGELARSSCCIYRCQAIIFGGQIDLLSPRSACRALGMVFIFSSMRLRPCWTCATGNCMRCFWLCRWSCCVTQSELDYKYIISTERDSNTKKKSDSK